MVCIDATALSHLQAEELLYAEHKLARVLCDPQESCATPGHIVKFRGEAMMMKSYCTIVGCKERVIMVNSPRYKMGMRVQSRSEHLEYTALSARYETMVEETALRAAVRMGL